MKFVCDRCQTKYSIADERVRGKVLKVKCKSCANVITVREARQPSSAGLPTLSAGAARPRTAGNAALSIPMETPGVDVERTQLAQSPFGLEEDPFPELAALAPAPAIAPRRATGQMAAVAAADDHVQWYMALDGNRTGPFNRQKLVDKLLPLAKSADVHIWNEKLDGWKPPAGVPEVAAEIARRRAPAPPPPPVSTPRRPTPPPIPPLGNLTGPPHGQPARKPTGPHAPPSPLAHGPGAAGSKLPPPGGVHPALAAREHGAADASSLLETPAPIAHPAAHAKTNGVGHAHAPPKPVNSDVMQMLNLPGGTQTAPGAPPRLMSVTNALGWTAASADAAKGRSKTTAMLIGLLVVIGLIVVVAVISLKKPPRPVAVAVAPPVVQTAPAVVEPPQPPQPPVVEPPQPPQPPAVEQPTKGKGKQRGKGKQQTIAGKQPIAGTTPTATPPAGDDANRFRDNHNMNITGGGGGPKLPPPDQSAITRVISNNRASIKVCYQRALTRDNSLTHGKLSVKLSIGISGRVKHIALDGPTQFKTLLEPCIKDVVNRWAFPPSSEEYGTEFPLVFQGNE
ncbi:MAG TPA: AgmX/PglI C-terminal domain-containing protein [Polyangia bacterium]|jgi:predicted Zn finger-like uncharacterized protein|nr:AgmX/PglI C-terminal domain-containing protein [Polyangia bacterium]